MTDQFAASPSTAVPAASAAARILYVEDDFDSGELIRFLLSRENENYEVTIASTFDEAIGKINEKPFNLYLIDYCLPSKSGIQLCQYIRETDPQTPIIFYSAISREIDRLNAQKAGANEYLVKPMEMELLTKKVNQLLFEWALKK